MKRIVYAGIAGVLLASAPVAVAQNAPALSWEGMQKVRWERFDQGWQAPGVDFRSYAKVMLDPVDVSFRRNWQRDYNNGIRDLDRRVSDEDMQEMIDETRTGLADAFSRAAREAGYEVATAPGPDVLRLKVYLIDLDVHAPDLMTSARNRTFAEQAGRGRLVLELRDASSGALLAGGVDRREVGDRSFLMWRTSVSNRADFSRAFRLWANNSMNALRGLGVNPSAARG